MSDQQILEKAIQKAIDGGWEHTGQAKPKLIFQSRMA